MVVGHWSLVARAKPRERAIDDGRCRPLRFETLGRVRIARDLIVVGVESLREPEASIEHEGADKRRRLVPGRLQQARDRRMRVAQRIDAVLAHAVDRRQESREDRRVGWQRQRHRGARRGEAKARRGQPVERGRDPRPESIRTKGVNRHEQYVRLRRRGKGASAA
jgi:hypothetical protein